MIYGIIYRVINLEKNNKIYIGQTVNSINKRKVDHHSNARNNKFDIPFHRALRKYNEKAFVWEVIDQAITKNDLNKKEKFWISFYKSNDKNFGYNATYGGDSFGGKGEENYWFGRNRTEDNKIKISNTLKETRSKLGSPRNIPIVQLKTNGEFVAEYKNCVEPNMDRKCINGCCRGKQISYNGFFWLYKSDYKDEFVKTLVEKYENRKGGANKPIVALNLDGSFFKEYKSIEEAVLEVGGNGSNITACCRGRQKTCKGYIWIYKKDYKS